MFAVGLPESICSKRKAMMQIARFANSPDGEGVAH
jgi:hypothetical protein